MHVKSGKTRSSVMARSVPRELEAAIRRRRHAGSYAKIVVEWNNAEPPIAQGWRASPVLKRVAHQGRAIVIVVHFVANDGPRQASWHRCLRESSFTVMVTGRKAVA
jgi:hypothetical protein